MNEYLIPLLGGLLIGLGSLLALLAAGKVPGISGVVAKVMQFQSGDWVWRVVFLLGLIGGAAIAFNVNSDWQAYQVPGGRTPWVMALAGLLVGLGTRVGGGCTSGHGVCGIGSGARDALLYTIVFMASGAATVWIWSLLERGAAP